MANRYQYVVVTKAKPGREAEFEAWYADQHIDDVARVPGVVSARRFHIDRVVTPAGGSWVNLALYEIESDDPESVLAAIKSRAGTDEMPMTDALDRSDMLQFLAR